MDYKFYPKKPQKYFCEFCDFNSSNKKDYTRHLSTDKHKRMTMSSMADDGFGQHHNFKCDCGKEYKHRQGLWKHTQLCEGRNLPQKTPPHHEPTTDIKTLTNLVLEVVKHNNDLTNKIVDICKSGQSNMANNVNSNNVISNIIVKNLKALDVTERPIHCADKKREVIYIKDEDKWEKEDVDKKKLKRVIKKIAYKNEKLLPQYKQKYPDYNDSDSKRSDQFSKIIIEAMGGAGDNDAEKEQKILKNIAKEVVIDKTMNFID